MQNSRVLCLWPRYPTDFFFHLITLNNSGLEPQYITCDQGFLAYGVFEMGSGLYIHRVNKLLKRKYTFFKK